MSTTMPTFDVAFLNDFEVTWEDQSFRTNKYLLATNFGTICNFIREFEHSGIYSCHNLYVYKVIEVCTMCKNPRHLFKTSLSDPTIPMSAEEFAHLIDAANYLEYKGMNMYFDILDDKISESANGSKTCIDVLAELILIYGTYDRIPLDLLWRLIYRASCCQFELDHVDMIVKHSLHKIPQCVHDVIGIFLHGADLPHIKKYLECVWPNDTVGNPGEFYIRYIGDEQKLEWLKMKCELTRYIMGRYAPTAARDKLIIDILVTSQQPTICHYNDYVKMREEKAAAASNDVF
jgi:hypothetical protein